MWTDLDFRRLESFARRISSVEATRKKLSSDDMEDIVQQAIVDVFQKTGDEVSSIPEEILQQTVKRSVWRNAQAIYRRQLRQESHESNLLSDPKYELYASDWGDAAYEMIENVYEDQVSKQSSASPGKVFEDKKTEEQTQQLRCDLLIVNDELVRYFAQHPEKLYQLTPRKFEELVAEIMADMGYAIQLTKNSADGGVDIFATEKTNVGDALNVSFYTEEEKLHDITGGYYRWRSSSWKKIWANLYKKVWVDRFRTRQSRWAGWG